MLGFEMADHGLDGGPAAQLAFDPARHPTLLAGDEDPELVIRRRVVAAVALVRENAIDGVADQRLHLRDHGCQGVTFQRLDVGDELAALGVADGGGNADLDAELVRPVGFAFADAFDFRRVQGIDFGSALTLLCSRTRRASISNCSNAASSPLSPSILRLMSRMTRPSQVCSFFTRLARLNCLAWA